MSDFREWDRRSDRLRDLRLSNAKAGARSDVLLEPADSDGGALSDCMPEQQRLAINMATFDGQLRGMQKRHEEELEAIRKHYRRRESADVDNILVAKTREQEDEICRLQQEFNDLLRSREEELEQVIGTLREDADSKNQQLREINHEYKSLVRAHREIEKQFKDDLEGRYGKQTGDSDNSAGMPPYMSLKDAIVGCARDPIYLSLMVHLLGEINLEWQRDDDEGHDELIGLGFGLLVTPTVGVAAMSLLHLNGYRTLMVLGLTVLAIEMWTGLAAFAVAVWNEGVSFFAQLFEKQLAAVERELVAFVDSVREERMKTLVALVFWTVGAAFWGRVRKSRQVHTGTGDRIEASNKEVAVAWRWQDGESWLSARSTYRRHLIARAPSATD